MKAFVITLSFVAALILFWVVGSRLFNGAGLITFLFAFALATFVILLGWGFVDTVLPPQHETHDEEESH
jgi:hypothetical protein